MKVMRHLMKMTRGRAGLVVAAGAVAMVVLSAPTLAAQGAQAQTQMPVTTADLTRLDQMADAVGARLPRLRQSDPTLAAEVTQTLNDLRDDITYLKVKLRKEGSLTRQDVADVRDRLQTLSNRAGVDRVTAQPVINGDPMGKVVTVAVGTEFDVRLQTTLNSGTTKVESRFEATTILDEKINDDIVVPAGTVVRGFVSSVRPAGRVDRQGSLTMSFDEIAIGNGPQRLRASVVQALDGKMAQDNTRIGVGAAMGAILGGILGGGKGALVGVLVGGGGTMASTEGADVDLPLGTILRIRLDQPLDVTIGG
jgi:hypothetical protein